VAAHGHLQLAASAIVGVVLLSHAQLMILDDLVENARVAAAAGMVGHADEIAVVVDAQTTRGSLRKKILRMAMLRLPQQPPRFSVSGARRLRDPCGRGKLEQGRRHVRPQSKIADVGGMTSARPDSPTPSRS
jgi:hypothetical protein